MPVCSKCNGEGYTVTPDRKISPCSCFIEQRNRHRMDAAGVPRALQDSRLDHFFPTKDADHKPLSNSEEDRKQWAREVVSAYIENLMNSVDGEHFSHQKSEDGRTRSVRGNTLLLIGGHRSGKSLLAAIIARAALVHFSIPTAYIEWPVMLDACYDYEDRGDAMRDLISSNTKLLIVDNLRPDVTHDWVKRKLDAAFAERERLMLPTVFTTSEVNIEKMAEDGLGSVLSSMVRGAAIVILPAGKGPGDTEVD